MGYVEAKHFSPAIIIVSCSLGAALAAVHKQIVETGRALSLSTKKHPTTKETYDQRFVYELGGRTDEWKPQCCCAING